MHPSALLKVWGAQPPTTPMGRALRPSTPGDFPVAGKVTKGAPRAAPFGIPWCKIFALFGAALALAPGLPSATKIDRFATLRWWANRSCFFLWFHQGNTLCFQSVARQGCPRGCLKVSVLATNTARAESRGNPRGSSPLCRRSRNQEVPGVSLPTFSTRESRPGHGAERP